MHQMRKQGLLLKLEALQRQQPTAGLPESSSLLTPPCEAHYFKGEGLMETALPTPNTPAGSISTITVGILPPARVLAEDLMKATLREGSPNLLQMDLKCVGKQATSESTDSRSAGE